MRRYYASLAGEPEPYIERVATMGSQFLVGHVIHGRHFVSKCRHSYGTAIG